MASKLQKKLILGIKKFFRATGKDKAVVGLSGGIDSALVCALLVRALGKQKVAVLLLPVKGLSSEKNVKDAESFAKKLGVKSIKIEINSFKDAFLGLKWVQNKAAKANTLARIRAVLLYNYANSNDCLVVGTGNRTEIMLGYFTKYGDGAADFFPIGKLWKTQVFQLAKEMKLPKEFLEKTPTAELFEGQTDEKELGATYKEMDAILVGLFDKGKTPQKLVSEGHKASIVRLIQERAKENRHKREFAPSISL